MRNIPLSNGMFALVDDEDFDALVAFKWHADRHKHTFYTLRRIKRSDGAWASERMHRVVLSQKIGRKLAVGETCDHINGDGLDNRRENLRVATTAQNHRNRHRRAQNTSSQYLGVYWHRRDARWGSHIKVNGKSIHLGYHLTELDAAMAREAYIAAYPELQARSYFLRAERLP